jgi:hypothetical protein
VADERPDRPRRRWGRFVAGVAFTAVMLPAAAGVLIGAAVAGCWHDCTARDTTLAVGLGVGGCFAVLGAWAAGLVALRARTWWPFVAVCATTLVAARVAEFVLTR